MNDGVFHVETSFMGQYGPLDPWYVTVFLDGEGTFTFSRSGGHIGLYLTIKRPLEDRSIVEAVQRFFGAGKIYPANATGGAPKAPAGRHGLHLRITRNSDLGRVVDHLDAYPLRSRKAAAYHIWREMVVLRRAFRSGDPVELSRLAGELATANAR